jgi:tetratricopeptide (TPR) repeat protein
VLGAESVPAELRDLVYRKAEGNPFFVEEIVKSLVEVGALRSAGDGYVLAQPIEDVYVPDTVQDVIMARLDRLADEPRRAIQTAAVIGREFTVRLLERTSELEGRLEAYLKELKAVELIFERSLFPELAYMFKHALTHDVAYGSLLSPQRRSLHRLVGDAIEELYRDRLAEHYEVLAYHYGRAEDWQKVLDYGLEAARKAAARLAVRDAIGFYERALVAAEHLKVPPSQHLAIRGTLAPLYFALGDFPRSRAEAEQAVELARALGDGAAEGRALFDAATAVQFAEDFPGALALAEQAAEVAQRTDAPTAWAGAEFISAYIRAITGELNQAIPRLGRVIDISRAAGDVARESLGLVTLGAVHHWQAEPRRAAALTGEGLRIAREHNLVVPLTRNLWSHGMVLTAGGRYAEGLALLEEGLALVERIGDENNEPRYLNTIGWLYGECGDLDQALAKAEATIERARRRRHGIGVEQTAFSLVNMADVFMARGDLAAAGEALEETRQLVEDPTHDWMKWRYKMHMLVSAGEYRLMRGEPAEAEELAARSLAIAGHTTSRKYLVRGWRLQGEIAAATRHWSEAKDALGQALALARQIDNPPQLWRTLWALGQLHDALGERDAAAAALQDARRVVDELQAGLADERLRTSLARAAESGILYRTAAPV